MNHKFALLVMSVMSTLIFHACYAAPKCAKGELDYTCILHVEPLDMCGCVPWHETVKQCGFSSFDAEGRAVKFVLRTIAVKQVHAKCGLDPDIQFADAGIDDEPTDPGHPHAPHAHPEDDPGGMCAMSCGVAPPTPDAGASMCSSGSGACEQCGDTSCCAGKMACAGDQNCQCWTSCELSGFAYDECSAAPGSDPSIPSCGPQGAITGPYDTCLVNACSNVCGTSSGIVPVGFHASFLGAVAE